MKQLFLILSASLLLWACSPSDKQQSSYLLQGAWTLSQIVSPEGRSRLFPANGMTYLRIYDGDSVLYQCRLTQTASAMVIQSDLQCDVTLINKGGGERLYLEEDNPRPLIVKDDTTIVIQMQGVLYTWHRADEMAKDWSTDICDIIARDLRGNCEGEIHSYVLSAKEREQADIIHVLACSVIAFALLLFVFVQVAMASRKEKQRLQLLLKQIREEHEERPQPVRHAIESVENDYFSSDDYHSLQRRIATGGRLKEEEWDAVEAQVKRLYPGFTSQLRSLHPMSELEYKVCLLIKLRVAPSDIAAVLSRDVSTISTVRSRLYKKVFDRKGGAREWDEFVLSIGA